MILTAIPREQLGEVLDRFMAKLENPFSRAVFRRIRATSADRAVGAASERHRCAALSLARRLGMAVHADGVECPFNWDGRALNGSTEAYVILHEAAHFVLAPSERRRLVDFGLGPGPDTRDRDAAARAAVLSPVARDEDEAAASLLGIIWEAQLGQPALASFLDQNWLEGLERSAHSHFAWALGKLQRRGVLDLKLPGVFDRVTFRGGRGAATRTAEPGCTPDPFAEAPGECAKLPRPATPASMRRALGRADTLSLRGGSPDLPSEPPGQPPVQHPIGTRVPGGSRNSTAREGEEAMNQIDLGGRSPLSPVRRGASAVRSPSGFPLPARSRPAASSTSPAAGQLTKDQATCSRPLSAVRSPT
jgi:hypothetical protein